MIDHEQLERIAEHYEAGDASADLDRADYDDSTMAEPMVTTSLRLPKPVMDAVRAVADARGMRPTALMREWVEQQVVDLATAAPHGRPDVRRGVPAMDRSIINPWFMTCFLGALVLTGLAAGLRLGSDQRAVLGWPASWPRSPRPSAGSNVGTRGSSRSWSRSARSARSTWHSSLRDEQWAGAPRARALNAVLFRTPATGTPDHPCASCRVAR
jgi:hypothetical protein